ncbi:hypothetical protein BHYA_0276g00070 [Botrytis hyacinthi]|uniref:Heterokaryon incompatibility domain-containing protein n=1 Tax=Botrytis hyacinthi TaxID=278943 RepID=A0A4Z1GC62_9HELO|nr:hypothetical protein BHYA_0276g00070 [Botrytis hyacinthi]
MALVNTPCRQCQKFSVDHGLPGRSEDWVYQIEVPYHQKDTTPYFPGLLASFNNGCSLCGVLRDVLLNKFAESRSSKNGEVTISAKYGCQLELPVYNHLTFEVDGAWEIEASFVVYAEYGDGGNTASKYFLVRPGSRKWNYEAISIAQMWLKMCNKHDTCRGTTPSILPTRVIDVKSSPPKLVMGNGIIDKYVTLSHCWGISREHPFEAQYTSQTSTVSSRMEGMPLEDLPATFRDAVIATRDLGFQYLWIDSICILQDSIPDKSIEIARMGDVYGNAALCICATSGINSKSGFLPPYPSLQPSVKLPFYPMNSEPGSYILFSQDLYRSQNEFPIDWTWDIHQRSIWNTRAWTLQERVLSPRILHFTCGRMYFECGKGFFMEKSPEQELTENDLAGLRVEAGFIKTRRLGHPTALNSNDLSFDALVRLYYNLVDQYCQRNLSYSSDKAAAFAACSDLFQKRLGFHTNVYGTYLEDLPRCLMWIPLGNSSLDSSWPSWLWCSHQHLSFYQGIFHIEDSEVLNTDQELSHKSNHEYLPATDSQPQILRLHAFSKGPGKLIWKKSYPMSVKFSVMGHECDLEHADITNNCATGSEDLWLLNFCKLGAQAKPISGLILQPAVESGSNHYRRVGFYRLNTAADSRKLFQTEARQWTNLV